MNVRITTLFALTAFLTIAIPAKADWVILGVAAQCAKDGSSFHLLPVAETSNVFYDSAAPAGAYKFEEGDNQKFQCNLGGNIVQITLSVFGPQARGMGQGSGGVTISKLSVNKKEIINMPVQFNWQVLEERVLTEVSIKSDRDGLNVTLCNSNGWSWDDPYADKQCKTSRVSANPSPQRGVAR